MKRVVILSNHHSYTYNFRREIIQALLDENYEVYVVLPYGEKVDLLIEMGCEFINVPLSRRGVNPIEELNLLRKYYKILKELEPDAVLSYTIKPNIYGGLVCRKLDIPFYPNITGLGTSGEDGNPFRSILMSAYNTAFKNASCVFFQNETNKQLFLDYNVDLKNYKVIPGSGVNLNHFYFQEYPSTDNTIEFVFISRIMKEKGIDQYLEAAEYITKKYPNTKFHICGFCEQEYEEILEDFENRGIIKYHGMINDVREILKTTHCTVHPTYYPEGLSNVLLESAASGRPIISTDRSGTRETIDDGLNGFLIKEKNTQDLIKKVENFIKLSSEEKRNMGINGREKVVKEFDRQIVVDAYLDELKEVNNVNEVYDGSH